MAIEVFGAISPPDRPALPERSLGVVDGGTSGNHGVRILRRASSLDCAAGIHELRDQLSATMLGQIRVGGAPQASADHDVATVRSRELRQVGLTPNRLRTSRITPARSGLEAGDRTSHFLSVRSLAQTLARNRPCSAWRFRILAAINLIAVLLAMMGAAYPRERAKRVKLVRVD